MRREIVEKIYHDSVNECVEKSIDDSNQAWMWEENMVKNTIKELKYALAVNSHVLTLDQIAIINEVFGDIL